MRSSLIKSSFVIIYIVLYLLCIICSLILAPLLFNADKDTSNTDKSLIKLNSTQIELSKTVSIINMIFIIPVMICFFYVNKTALKGKLPHFVNRISVGVYFILYIMSVIALIILIQKLFNSNSISSSNTIISNTLTDSEKQILTDAGITGTITQVKKTNGIITEYTITNYTINNDKSITTQGNITGGNLTGATTVGGTIKIKDGDSSTIETDLLANPSLTLDDNKSTRKVIITGGEVSGGQTTGGNIKNGILNNGVTILGNYEIQNINGSTSGGNITGDKLITTGGTTKNDGTNTVNSIDVTETVQQFQEYSTQTYIGGTTTGGITTGGTTTGGTMTGGITTGTSALITVRNLSLASTETETGLSLNSSELSFLQTTTIIYFIAVLPVIMYCFYLLRNVWMPKL